MVGGIVIGVSRKGDTALVTCEDENNVLSVRCEGERISEIRLGDFSGGNLVIATGPPKIVVGYVLIKSITTAYMSMTFLSKS